MVICKGSACVIAADKAAVLSVNHKASILANFQISERGTNERKCSKKERDIPTFPILYYIQIF